jgi:hypothetical protein
MISDDGGIYSRSYARSDMPSSAIESLYEFFPAVIRQMPSQFTSHQFILELVQQRQPEYVAALTEYAAGGEPFRAVHQQLSANLHKYSHLVAHEGTVRSKDIFGHSNTCAKWRRL